jgi:hypothetical protein
MLSLHPHRDMKQRNKKLKAAKKREAEAYNP